MRCMIRPPAKAPLNIGRRIHSSLRPFLKGALMINPSEDFSELKIVLHPNDWARIAMLQGESAQYYLGQDHADGDPPKKI